MTRRPIFPDVNGRTENNPCILVKKNKIVCLYKNAVRDKLEEAEIGNIKSISADYDVVIDWFTSEALRLGWSKVSRIGDDVLLIAQFINADSWAVL